MSQPGINLVATEGVYIEDFMKQLPLSHDGKHALVDDDDFERLARYRWFYKAERDGLTGYAIRRHSCKLHLVET